MPRIRLSLIDLVTIGDLAIVLSAAWLVTLAETLSIITSRSISPAAISVKPLSWDNNLLEGLTFTRSTLEVM